MAETFKVLVADDLSDRGVAILRSSKRIEVDVKVGLKPAELLPIIGAYHGLVVRSATKVTAPILEAASRLRIVGRAGIGVDNIDVSAATRQGVIVENTPTGNAVTTAEHAIALLMALARRIPQAHASMKAGKWEKKRFQGTEVLDKTLGIVGLGNIGRVVADRGRGLKMKVVAHDPFISGEAAKALGAELVPLEELYRRSDFISLHVPALPDTRGMIDAAALARMKRGVFIINASRGEIVDEAALLAALDSGQVAGAAIDVYLKEPPEVTDPLVNHERVVCTPHLGASTEEAQAKVAVEVAEQMVAFFDRGEIRNAVNVPAILPEILPRLAPWADLATRLGALAGQLRAGEVGIDELEVEMVGEIAELGAHALSRAAVAGLLRTFMGVPVNEVNAAVVAAERGLKIVEVKRSAGRTYANALGVRTRGKAGTRFVQGIILDVGERPEPRVVRIDDFALEAAPEGRVLMVRNADRPGVIGAVGTLLGARGINVARLNVGLDQNGNALMLWNVADELDAALLGAIRTLPNVQAAQQVTW